MLIPIDSDMDFFTSLQKLSRPFAFFRHGEKRPRFLVMFQPSPSHWVINMVGFFAALLSETGWIISAAQLLSWFANFEQTSLAEVAMSHIRVASVPSTSWTGTVTCWPLNLYIRVYIYIYDVRYLYQQTGRLKWCYILLYSFNGISWDYTVYWHCLTILALFNDGLCPSSQRSSREFSHHTPSLTNAKLGGVRWSSKDMPRSISQQRCMVLEPCRNGQ